MSSTALERFHRQLNVGMTTPTFWNMDRYFIWRTTGFNRSNGPGDIIDVTSHSAAPMVTSSFFASALRFKIPFNTLVLLVPFQSPYHHPFPVRLPAPDREKKQRWYLVVIGVTPDNNAFDKLERNNNNREN
jgi:hypothetical protein